MTSLDFKALLAQERAAMLHGSGAKSSKLPGEYEDLLLGAKDPLDWEGHAFPGDVEGVTYVPGTRSL